MALEKTFALTIDFCETATPEATLRWADKRLMNPDATAKMQALRDRLLPKLYAGSITREEMDDWMVKTFAIYAEQGVTREQIVMAMRGFPLREGFIDLLQWARLVDVPVAIISGSCTDFIDLALHNAGVRHLVTEVYSTNLTYDERGKVTGVLGDSIVHNFTKGSLARRWAERCGIDTKRLIGLGDSNNDIDLAGEDGYLIGLVGNEARAKQLNGRFNHVVVSDHVGDALNVIKQRVLA